MWNKMDELTSIINKIIEDLNFDEFEYDTDRNEWFHLFDKTHYDIIYMVRLIISCVHICLRLQDMVEMK